MAVLTEPMPRPGPAAAESRWIRWAPYAGTASAALLIVSLLLSRTFLKSFESSTTADAAAFFTDNRTPIAAAVPVAMLAAFCFVWFLASLRRLDPRPVGWDPLLVIAAAAGTLFATLIVGGQLAHSAIVSGYAFGPADYQVDGTTALSLNFMWYDAWGAAGIALAALVGATSALGARTGVLPAALSRTGFVLVPVLLLTAVAGLIPLVLGAGWIAAISLTLARR